MVSLNVPIKWNSTYLMLDVATEKTFERFDKQHLVFKIDLKIKRKNY